MQISPLTIGVTGSSESHMTRTGSQYERAGLTRTAAGDTVTLRPGESISLPQRLYHRFWGEKGKGTVLVGEVSRVNDDRVDNRFHDPVGRFPDIEEDEPPLHLLYGDYPKYYRHGP